MRLLGLRRALGSALMTVIHQQKRRKVDHCHQPQGRELLFSLSASHLWITFDHMLDPEVNDWQTLGAEVDPGIYDSFS